MINLDQTGPKLGTIGAAQHQSQTPLEMTPRWCGSHASRVHTTVCGWEGVNYHMTALLEGRKIKYSAATEV